ncbi:MAG: ATP-binding protein [Fusobacteriaceae bacterium]
MIEKLEYMVDDSVIAELLGVQNFTNKESAILELVKNSFDAKAEILKIYFEENQIIIEDDGIGMSSQDIKTQWMHVGKSRKGYLVLDKKNNERILAGSKGIGRFALSRLGKDVSVYSKQEKNNQILWTTDWNTTSLDEIEGGHQQIGTKIIIKKLRDSWSETSIRKLSDYLSRTIKHNIMKIFLIFNNQKLEIEDFFSKPVLGVNCLAKISLNYNSGNKLLTCSIESDEFKKDAELYYKENSINKFTKVINILDELKKDKKFNDENNLLEEKLSVLGSFKSELYFILKPNKVDAESFMYKHTNLEQLYTSGVILYRNFFSISSYDGTKDWIGFSKRARKSPATATHPTGMWRVRDNNIAGKVEIDKKENSKLQDLSNRQGFEENEYYDMFLKILDKGLSIFEKYRQSIIREIDKKNNIIETTEDELLSEILRTPIKLKKLSIEEANRVVCAVKKIKEETKIYKIKLIDTEKKHNYDTRILNTLSTSGLKATSIAHDLETHNNFIAVSSDLIIKALESCNVWDIVNSEENIKISNKNVPYLINRSREVNIKLSEFMSNILEESKKSSFTNKEIKILEFLEKMKMIWKKQYSRVNIELSIDDELIILTGEDKIRVIFDNLILNTIQQNNKSTEIRIEIKILKEDKKIKIIYKDFGKGLDKNYQKDPFIILEVHETNRNDGHGLGMWIIHNTIKSSNGEIQIIKNHEKGGFQIEFTFGD